MIRVVGCGNLDAGDDAVGVLAVRAAAERLERVGQVEIVLARSSAAVLDALIGADAVVIVDAVRTDGDLRRPGEIVVADPAMGALRFDSSMSSHGLGPAETVGVGRALGFTPRVVVVGVEVEDVRAGHGLSPAVAAAVPATVERIVEETRRLTTERSRSEAWS